MHVVQRAGEGGNFATQWSYEKSFLVFQRRQRQKKIASNEKKKENIFLTFIFWTFIS